MPSFCYNDSINNSFTNITSRKYHKFKNPSTLMCKIDMINYSLGFGQTPSFHTISNTMKSYFEQRGKKTKKP